MKNRELESLHAIDLAIASSMELDKILTVILKEAREHLGSDASDILLLDAETSTLSLGARLGFRTRRSCIPTSSRDKASRARRSWTRKRSSPPAWIKTPRLRPVARLRRGGLRVLRGEAVDREGQDRRRHRTVPADALRPSASWSLFFRASRARPRSRWRTPRSSADCGRRTPTSRRRTRGPSKAGRKPSSSGTRRPKAIAAG
jgi:GAF domain-containing protein